MSCEPEKVTALVDGALPAAEASRLQEHVASCGPCRALADAERAVRHRLRTLPPSDAPFGFETRLRARLREADPRRSSTRRLLRLALPVAAVLALVFWARGIPGVLAWELVNDHRHCYSFVAPPATVQSSDPAVVTAWFARQGTRMPVVPAEVGQARLFGARYCYFPDLSSAPHLYYTGGPRPLSLFVLGHDARFGESWSTTSSGHSVALLRMGDTAVGVVGDDPADVDAAVRRLRVRDARLQDLVPAFEAAAR